MCSYLYVEGKKLERLSYALTPLSNISYWCYLWNENSVQFRIVYSIDNLKVIARDFISKRRGKEQGSRDRERECVRVQVLGDGQGSISCKQTVRKYTCWNKQNVQHLGWLSLIIKMRNLANEVSHDRSVLTAEIFQGTTIWLFLTNSYPRNILVITKLNSTKA